MFTSNTCGDASNSRWTKARDKKQAKRDRMKNARSARNPDSEYDNIKPLFTMATKSYPLGRSSWQSVHKLLIEDREIRIMQQFCHDHEVT